jgi:8-amino-7-oxononanoate synthase
MLPSSPLRALSTSSRTAQLKEYVFLFFIIRPLVCLSSHETLSLQQLAAQVLEHSIYLQKQLRASLAASSIPAHILTLPAHIQKHHQPSMAQPPTPIIPLLTPRARDLSAHLLTHGLNARPISWPTVPKGTDRVRVCLHAGNTREEIDALVNASIAWAADIRKTQKAGPEGDRARIEESVGRIGPSRGEFLLSKL